VIATPPSRIAVLWLVLRDGRLVTWSRVRGYSIILVIAYLAVLVWTLTGPGDFDPAGHPVGTDFVSFWTASSLTRLNLAAIYHPEALAAAERAAIGGTGHDVGLYAWFYPPPALLLVWPLALLPYLWSLLAWLIAGMAAYLATIRGILPDRSAMLAALAFPAVFVTASHGQNAFITTALLGGALLALERRPAVAGVLIGALAFKPQLGILIPVALIAGGHWRAIVAAAITLAVTAAVTLAAFGADIWQDFAATAELSRQTLEQGLVPFYKIQSVFAMARGLGLGVPVATIAQGLATLASALIVIRVWRKPGPQDIKNAVLVVAGLLATPFALDYDLLLLALPIAWLSARALRDGAPPFELTLLAALFLLPLIARPFASVTHLSLTPFALTAFLALISRRADAATDAGSEISRRRPTEATD
jgi:hypothetical protein